MPKILAQAMCDQGLTTRFAEVRRLISANAIWINDRLATSWDEPVHSGDVIACGKHKKITVR